MIIAARYGFSRPHPKQILTVLLTAMLAIVIASAPLMLVLGIVASAVCIIFALVYPWIAWIAIAIALPISSGQRIGPGSATDLLLAAAIALWFASIAGKSHATRSIDLPTWPLLLYIFALYLSSFMASNLDEALTEMVKWLEFGAIILIVPSVLPSRVVPWLVAALLTAAAIQGIYGLYQFIYRVGPEWFLIQDGLMRASGVFLQPNPFGAYLGLSLPVAYALLLWGAITFWQRRHKRVLLWSLFYGIATISIATGLAASWSRGAWLGAFAAVVVVMACFNRRTAIVLALCALLLLAAALLGSLNPAWIPSSISARLGNIPAYFGFVDVLTQEVNDDNFAVLERVAHWVAAIRMWESSVWLGVGPGNFAAAYSSVALPIWQDPLGHAHNIYLNVIGETGLVGITTFLLFWSTLVAWLLMQIFSVMQPNSWSRALAVGVLGIMAHVAVHSIFDNLLVQGMYLHIALWLAAVAATKKHPGMLPLASTNLSQKEIDPIVVL